MVFIPKYLYVRSINILLQEYLNISLIVVIFIIMDDMRKPF